MSDKIRELLPCPFCDGDASSDAHAEDCYFSVLEAFKTKAMNNADMSLAQELLRAWNIRAAVAQQPAPVNTSVIRDVFLRNGFTIKEGQTDLKPYVYAAAEELLSLDGKAVAAAPAAPVAHDPVAWVLLHNGDVAYDRDEAIISNRPGDCLDESYEWRAVYVAPPAAEQPGTAKIRDLLKRYFDALDRFDREGPVSLVVAAAKEADALEKELRDLLAGGA